MSDLSDSDRAMLGGEFGAGVARAMRIVMAAARIQGVDGLLDVTGAHIDGCLYHGQAGLDFAVALVDGGAAVRVPTTLNVSSLDLLHPELYRGDPAVAAEARKLMAAYQSMGCRPTWTCAPYQLPVRPGFGEHVAWAESNAIVFANSVLVRGPIAMATSSTSAPRSPAGSRQPGCISTSIAAVRFCFG